MTAALHTAVLVTLLVGYIVLTALGHDGSALLTAFGGWAAGAGVQAARPAIDEALKPTVRGE